MPPKSATQLDSQLRNRIDAFTWELTELVRRAALATLQEALGTQGHVPSGRRSRPRAAQQQELPLANRPVGRKRGKRPPEELERVQQQLIDYVAQNPGQSIEAIAQAMGVTTRELNLPVKKLVAARKLKTRGHKRATRYLPA
jgi:DNA-binding NtrC family response regulator